MNTILWIDDEIELLQPYVMYLTQKGYRVLTANSGQDALDIVRASAPDIAFLDEQMPGMSGLEVLPELKAIRPAMPVVMITKSEEEDIMERAIGQQIADYLIKPVNPSQILLCLKKHLHSEAIAKEHTTQQYIEEMPDIAYLIQSATTLPEWAAVQRTLTQWEMRLGEADPAMREMLHSQRQEANQAFLRYVRSNYESLLAQRHDGNVILSPDLMRRSVFPLLDRGEKVCVVVIDNFRYDQWKTIEPLLAPFLTVEDEPLYCSILPTATQYARNALFAGLMPGQIREMYPELWIDESEAMEDEEGLNKHEEELLSLQLQRFRRKETFSFFKVNESDFCERVTARLKSVQTPLNIFVLSFIDMLSHSRTDSKMMRELMQDEAAYRAITRSWFEHSPTLALLRRMAELGYHVLLTTDHGTIRVQNTVTILGDRETNTNLRYKVGKAITTDVQSKTGGKQQKVQTYRIEHPEACGLPCPNLSSSYIFAGGSDFFSYPNRLNYYAQYYQNTFQHGGVSLEEMLIPLVLLRPKGER